MAAQSAALPPPMTATSYVSMTTPVLFGFVLRGGCALVGVARISSLILGTLAPMQNIDWAKALFVFFKRYAPHGAVPHGCWTPTTPQAKYPLTAAHRLNRLYN